jgi:hypothetical protein
MTTETNSSAARSKKLADDAIFAYEVARDVFMARINALKADPAIDDDTKDVNALLGLMSRAILTAVEQTRRIEDDICKSNGGMSDGTFDLDAARSEIGVRLACLSAASDAGGLSFDPE